MPSFFYYGNTSRNHFCPERRDYSDNSFFFISMWYAWNHSDCPCGLPAWFNLESKQEREWFEWRFYAWAYVNIMRSCSSYKQICLFLLLRTKTLLHIMSLELIQIYMCINHLAVLEKWRNVTHYHITSSNLFRIWYLGSTQAANCLFSRNKQIQMHLQIYAKYEKSRRVLMKAP